MVFQEKKLCLGSPGVVFQEKIKKVQNRAVSFETSNYDA